MPGVLERALVSSPHSRFYYYIRAVPLSCVVKKCEIVRCIVGLGFALLPTTSPTLPQKKDSIGFHRPGMMPASARG